MRWIITETNNGHKFQFTKFSVTDFFLNDRKKVFQVHSQNRLVAIFRGQKSISVLSREKFFYQSHWIRNFRFFLSSVWPSSPSRQFWTTVSVSDTNSVFQCFRSGHNSRKHWIENGEGFAIYSSTWQSGAKGAKGVTCQQLIGDVKSLDALEIGFLRKENSIWSVCLERDLISWTKALIRGTSDRKRFKSDDLTRSCEAL